MDLMIIVQNKQRKNKMITQIINNNNFKVKGNN